MYLPPENLFIDSGLQSRQAGKRKLGGGRWLSSSSAFSSPRTFYHEQRALQQNHRRHICELGEAERRGNRKEEKETALDLVYGGMSERKKDGVYM